MDPSATQCSHILSFSTTVLETIPHTPKDVQVIGCFDQAFNVLINNRIVAFVLPSLLNGPFHIIVDDLPSLQSAQHMIMILGEQRITLGDWSCLFTEKTISWDPKPQWERLNISQVDISHICTRISSLLHQNTTRNGHTAEDIQQLLTTTRTKRLEHALHHESHPDIKLSVQTIVGLGPGLTPTGDDFLAGVMLSLWALHHPKTRPLCNAIVEAAQNRTTHISLAYLDAIAKGQVDEKWHRFFSHLIDPNLPLLEKALCHILDFGATSGSDTLYGFLWGIQHQNR